MSEMVLEAYKRHRFSVTDYHRMDEAGVFPADSRIELIDGELIEPVAPMQPPHASGVQRLNKMMLLRLSDRAEVRCQLPVILDDFSEPHPDFSVARFDAHGYAEHHPEPPDLFLLVEVADSSRDQDHRIKIPLYARAGVPEAWLVDLVDERVLVYRDPGPNGYEIVRIAQRGESIAPLTFPDQSFAVSDIMAPK